MVFKKRKTAYSILRMRKQCVPGLFGRGLGTRLVHVHTIYSAFYLCVPEIFYHNFVTCLDNDVTKL